MNTIDADDLAMLATGFESAMLDSTGTAATVAALHDLGWAELLDAAPAEGIATAFALLGSTGSSAGLIDDVLTHALGVDVAATIAVALPAPGRSAAPGHRVGDRVVIDGTISARYADATAVIVAIADETAATLVTIDPALLDVSTADALDPSPAFHLLRGDVSADSAIPAHRAGSWDAAVDAARVALAHQLGGAARAMLEQARQHAVDREQFGRPVATFQALRHKLAEAFVQIEGAAAVADTWDESADPLIAASAKSLAGQAARTSGTNSQQVLAGIGFTTDHPFQRWLKRTLVLDQLFGSASTLPGEIGAELIRRGAAPRLVEL